MPAMLKKVFASVACVTVDPGLRIRFVDDPCPLALGTYRHPVWHGEHPNSPLAIGVDGLDEGEGALMRDVHGKGSSEDDD